MFSESSKYLTKLKSFFKSPHPIIKTLNDKKNELQKNNKEKLDKLKLKAQNLNKEIVKIEKEKQNIENIKNNQEIQISNINDEKLTHAKRIVSLEEELLSIESAELSIKKQIELKEEFLRNINIPTVDDFYVQIVKGFNITFNKNKVQIKNQKKNAFFEIELKNDNEIVEDVWRLMN
ncbi:hypothetical protein DMUE_4704 [Dictyocoela muelleri]|nr:hypothetical protein DMUE_4704 [Dictyocoela muelleri]